MHTITFFPLGNADCCRIDTSTGKKLLVDFGNMRAEDDKSDKRIDLAAALKKDLSAAKRKGFDVVAFTHLDNDHVRGAAEFFFLSHAARYQSGDRATIGEMWVPAAVIVEDQPDGDARVVQAEARYRLKQKQGIRVFSRPGVLRDWLEAQDLNVDDFRGLFVDAGTTVPGWTLEADGIEFFVHSPFAEHCDDTEVDRNTASLVFQVRFIDKDGTVDLILAADTDHEVWKGIINVTKYHGREERLHWDIFKLAHHCSYLSLSPEKGKEKTEPIEDVRWLFEDQSADACVIVSTSEPIPTTDTDQPPHFQAAKYYKSVAAGHDGDFIVTMEHPSSEAPEPITFEIGSDGLVYKQPNSDGTGAGKLSAAVAAARGSSAPPTQRVGFGRHD